MMIKKAIEKITEEMKKDKNPYIQVVGNYVLSQMEINPNSLEDIVNGNKTINGSLKEMEKEAKKKAVNGVAILSDQEGLAIVGKYFEFIVTQINLGEAINKTSNAIDYKEKKEERQFNKTTIDFNYRLEDFLK